MGHVKEIEIACTNISGISNRAQRLQNLYISELVMTMLENFGTEPSFRANFLLGYVQSVNKRTSFSGSTVLVLARNIHRTFHWIWLYELHIPGALQIPTRSLSRQRFPIWSSSLELVLEPLNHHADSVGVGIATMARVREEVNLSVPAALVDVDVLHADVEVRVAIDYVHRALPVVREKVPEVEDRNGVNQWLDSLWHLLPPADRVVHDAVHAVPSRQPLRILRCEGILGGAPADNGKVHVVPQA